MFTQRFLIAVVCGWCLPWVATGAEPQQITQYVLKFNLYETPLAGKETDVVRIAAPQIVVSPQQGDFALVVGTEVPVPAVVDKTKKAKVLLGTGIVGTITATEENNRIQLDFTISQTVEIPADEPDKQFRTVEDRIIRRLKIGEQTGFNLSDHRGNRVRLELSVLPVDK